MFCYDMFGLVLWLKAVLCIGILVESFFSVAYDNTMMFPER